MLQHDLIASVFDNKSALQYMCGDVMRHLADVGTSDPLGKVLVPILCSLLLSWASRYRYRGCVDEETEAQGAVKKKTAGCHAISCPCVLFHLLELPGAYDFFPPPGALSQSSR